MCFTVCLDSNGHDNSKIENSKTFVLVCKNVYIFIAEKYLDFGLQNLIFKTTEN